MLELNKTLKTLLLLTAISATTFVNSAIAHDSAKKNNHPNFSGRIIQELNLSDAQAAKVKKLFNSQKESRKAHHEKMNEVHELVQADKVEQAADMAASVARERVLRNAAHKKALEDILTPKQQAKMKAMKKRMKRNKKRKKRDNNNRHKRRV